MSERQRERERAREREADKINCHLSERDKGVKKIVNHRNFFRSGGAEDGINNSASHALSFDRVRLLSIRQSRAHAPRPGWQLFSSRLVKYLWTAYRRVIRAAS